MHCYISVTTELWQTHLPDLNVCAFLLEGHVEGSIDDLKETIKYSAVSFTGNRASKVDEQCVCYMWCLSSSRGNHFQHFLLTFVKENEITFNVASQLRSSIASLGIDSSHLEHGGLIAKGCRDLMPFKTSTLLCKPTSSSYVIITGICNASPRMKRMSCTENVCYCKA
jgi:hypothetical protein